MKRVTLIVLDSLGIGALPDAHKYGDEGSNTLRSIYEANKELKIPNLIKMGLGNIGGVDIGGVIEPIASYGRMAVCSKGKDTLVGLSDKSW